MVLVLSPINVPTAFLQKSIETLNIDCFLLYMYVNIKSRLKFITCFTFAFAKCSLPTFILCVQFAVAKWPAIAPSHSGTLWSQEPEVLGARPTTDYNA